MPGLDLLGRHRAAGGVDPPLRQRRGRHPRHPLLLPGRGAAGRARGRAPRGRLRPRCRRAHRPVHRPRRRAAPRSPATVGSRSGSGGGRSASRRARPWSSGASSSSPPSWPRGTPLRAGRLPAWRIRRRTRHRCGPGLEGVAGVGGRVSGAGSDGPPLLGAIRSSRGVVPGRPEAESDVAAMVQVTSSPSTTSCGRGARTRCSPTPSTGGAPACAPWSAELGELAALGARDPAGVVGPFVELALTLRDAAATRTPVRGRRRGAGPARRPGRRGQRHRRGLDVASPPATRDGERRRRHGMRGRMSVGRDPANLPKP